MIIYFETIPFFHAQLELDIHPDMSLHISLNTAYSSYEPSSFMSSFSSMYSIRLFHDKVWQAQAVYIYVYGLGIELIVVVVVVVF